MSVGVKIVTRRDCLEVTGCLEEWRMIVVSEIAE